MVFLTATLPPLQQREFEEAMLLQSPHYIRDSTHRVNIEYSVRRVQNGRGIIEVKKLVEVMLKTWVSGEKGVIYCHSYAKCQAMAYQLKCHYYYGGDSNDPEAVSRAQRAAGFQAWVNGETPFIVATAVLGSGINVPGIKVIIHLDPPYSLIDYSQEGGRGGRDGERVKAIIVVEKKDWPGTDAGQDAVLELKTREVRSLIRTEGCRRIVMGRCLDGDVRDCRRIEAVLCDNCERQEQQWKAEPPLHGLALFQARQWKVARGMERLEAVLQEIGEEALSKTCRMCWLFKGIEEAHHSWWICSDVDTRLSWDSCMQFQRTINYRHD
jgi:superfamily II DNA helicase RecQ